MGDSTHFPVQSVGRSRVEIAGAFYLNGASAPVTTVGSGFTVTRDDVGLFTVTFAERFARALHVECSLIDPAQTQCFANVVQLDEGGNGAKAFAQFQVLKQDATSKLYGAFDLSAFTGRRVTFFAIFSDASSDA